MISVLQLGRIDYATGLRLQQTLVDLRKADRIGDVVLLLEHAPVITLGRNAKEKNIIVSREQLAVRGVELFETDRGGDVTYHGPGQLVAYPIFDLRKLGENKTMGAVEYVRKLEEVLIRTCAEFGVVTGRIQGLTGVWTRRPHEAKIAAIGVHISRAVTSHGFALNVSTDLDYFKLIVPCGISDKAVTSLDREVAAVYPGRTIRPLTLEEVADVAAKNFGRVFNRQVLWLESLDDLLATAGIEARGMSGAAPEAESDKVGVPVQVPKEIRGIRQDDDTSWA